MLMMVCGIVLGKAKTTKVGMVWYEFNIVNESINESVTKVGIELLGQLKRQMCIRKDICKRPQLVSEDISEIKLGELFRIAV